MSMRLPRLRSLQNRLALLFFAITALGFAAVIFFFLPSSRPASRTRPWATCGRLPRRSRRGSGPSSAAT